MSNNRKKNTNTGQRNRSKDDSDAAKFTYDPRPAFQLLDLYYEQNKQISVKHQVDSYNQMIEDIFPSIVIGDHIIMKKITENTVITHRFTFSDPAIKSPMFSNDEKFMFPLDAIQKNLNYSSLYTVTVQQFRDIEDIATGEIKTTAIAGPERGVPLGKIPIMVGSNYCNLIRRPNETGPHCKYDAGGYFIINGNEKVVLSVESTIQRKPLVFVKKEQTNLIYYIKVNSRADNRYVGNTQKFEFRIKSKNNMVLTIPWFREISIFTVMRALGLANDNDIVNAILDPQKDVSMFNQLSIFMNTDNAAALTQDKAIDIMMSHHNTSKNYSTTDAKVREQQKRNELMKILAYEILPHVNSQSGLPAQNMLCKAYYIGYMIRKLLKCYISGKNIEEYKGCDDRDSLINKRVETTGILMATLFEQFFKKMLSDCSKVFKSKNTDDNNPPDCIPHIKPNPIEQGLRQALSTGAFGSKSRKGLSQMLNRMNNLHSSSYMRRLITPTQDASTNKLTGPRHLHATQYPDICPLETPEGPKTGIVKNFSLLTTVTTNLNEQIPSIMRYLNRHMIKYEDSNRAIHHKYVKIFLNNAPIGFTNNIIQIHHALLKMRFNGEIHRFVSLALNYREREFHISTEGGRIIRPFLTVTDGKLNFRPEMLKGITSWNEFLTKYPTVIEYLDKDEQMQMMLATFESDIIATKLIIDRPAHQDKRTIDMINRTNRYGDNVFVRYTHCEIHPTMMLGLISNNIPFTNHNQSPRGIFQYNQARQAMGLYISDWRHRIDISYILYHTMIPVVSSRASKYTGTHIFPAGENCVVAIASYTGYNQEDSIVMNGSSVDKGLFRAQALKKYIETIKKNSTSSQNSKFMKPDPSMVDSMKDANYDKLSEEGYIKVETPINDGDVIIGIGIPKSNVGDDEKPYKDGSVIYKSHIAGAIDKVIIGTNTEDVPILKMRVRSERIPIVGDKFSSRHGQKGTCGAKINRSDMPFTLSGIVPDLIINPNAFPKRMTIGQLIEGLLGKVCAIKGVYGDATAFQNVDLHDLNNQLIDLGFEEWGNETMVNGMTGKKMPVKLFITPIYYQRLKQMVGDKIHSRDGGPTQMLTRQPTEGRSRDGGFRIGEMERDALIAHGIAQFLKERTLDSSDIYSCYVCDICGLIAHRVPQQSYYTCTGCSNSTKVTKVVMPYCFKQLLHELCSLNILGRIRTPNSLSSHLI